MHRLFVGLRPPAPVRQRLSATMGGVPGARWQSDEQLHITLRFIGEVDGPVAEDIATALSSVHAAPIEAMLEGVGRFGSKGRTNTLWAGVRPHAPLADLHRKIDRALVRCGLQPERRAFLPHVTLARLNVPDLATDQFLATHAGLTSPAFRFDNFLLFESRLGHAAASYEAVQRYPLDG